MMSVPTICHNGSFSRRLFFSAMCPSTSSSQTVRRDFCLLVQQLVDTVLRKLLIDQDEEGAKNYTRQVISDLLQNKVDLSLLVVSKSLGKGHKRIGNTKQPHGVLRSAAIE